MSCEAPALLAPEAVAVYLLYYLQDEVLLEFHVDDTVDDREDTLIEIAFHVPAGNPDWAPAVDEAEGEDAPKVSAAKVSTLQLVVIDLEWSSQVSISQSQYNVVQVQSDLILHYNRLMCMASTKQIALGLLLPSWYVLAVAPCACLLSCCYRLWLMRCCSTQMLVLLPVMMRSSHSRMLLCWHLVVASRWRCTSATCSLWDR